MWLLQDPYHQSKLHDKTESKALRIILTIILAQYKILHVYGHQDNQQIYKLLPTQATLNVYLDCIVTTKSTLLINKHINLYPFSIYIKSKYVYHHCYEKLESNHMPMKQKIRQGRSITGRLRFFMKSNGTTIRKYSVSFLFIIIYR